MVKNTERDAQIVDRYKKGHTQAQLASFFGVTRTRINQILRKAGVSYNDSPRKVRGDRYGFVGSNITKEMKRRLQDESRRTGKSMSRLLEDALETRLGETRHNK
jgi:hypothetical protein